MASIAIEQQVSVPSTPPAVAPSRPGRLRRLAAAWPTLLVLALTAGLRLYHLRSAYDVHIDEVSYTQISDTVASGDGVRLYGRLFFLHPPMFFWVLGGLVGLLGKPDLLVDQILAYRPFSVACSLVTCAALMALVSRAAGRRVGLLAGVLYATDAFAIRFDSRLFLEALAMAFTAAGYLVLALRVTRPDRGVRWVLAAGLLFGCAVLTKDTALLVIAPALGIAVLAGRPVRRAKAAAVLGVAGACYATWVAALVVVGEVTPWFDEKSSGFRRLSGAVQATGYNRPDSPTLGSRLAANLEQFGASYVLVVLGAAAGLYVVLRLRRVPGHRADVGLVLGLWQLGAVAFLAYAKLFGSLEEQMFYFLLVPSVPAVCVAGTLLVERPPRLLRVLRPRPLLALGAVAVLAFATASWYRVHSTRSDGYSRVVAYVRDQVPAGSTIAATEDVGQFLLPGVRLGAWTLPRDFRRQGVDYVLVNTRLTAQGYGRATPELERYLAANADVAGRWGPGQDNLLILYRLRPPA